VQPSPAASWSLGAPAGGSRRPIAHDITRPWNAARVKGGALRRRGPAERTLYARRVPGSTAPAMGRPDSPIRTSGEPDFFGHQLSPVYLDL